MRPERSRAVTAATAPMTSTQAVYHRRTPSATAINEVPATFMLGLQNLRLSPTEPTGVLDVIDRLVRLKIGLGLVEEVRHVQ